VKERELLLVQKTVLFLVYYDSKIYLTDSFVTSNDLTTGVFCYKVLWNIVWVYCMRTLTWHSQINYMDRYITQ